MSLPMFFRRWFQKSTSKHRPLRKNSSSLRIEALEDRKLLAAADIVAENLLQGNPESEWGIDGTGTGNIQGFAADMSVDQGETVQFKIDTDTGNYRVDIYRLGWYGGLGARKVATVDPLSSQAQNQPNALYDSTFNMYDAGNWSVSAEWDVPADAVSGVYIAKLVREDGVFGENHIVFVVRDDDGGSDIIMQTSDTTWQAYNNWGGASLYTPNYPNGRGRAVSYNRPIVTRDINYADYLWGADYAMVRFLERNGYDVSYMTGIDASRYGSEILEHELYVSVGHDEYWSGEQREAVSAARDAGIDLAFFSGNEVFWKIRWEDSVDASGTPYRTMVCYKETLESFGTDPSDEWTGTWRDARFQDATGLPENELTGTIFTANHITKGVSNVAVSIEVPSEYAPLRFWRNTEVAGLTGNQLLAVGQNVLGYEFDEDLDNGFRPAGLIPLSYTTVDIDSKLYDEGYTFGPGTVNHSMTLYRASSGALVFGAGTVQYSWGLDTGHDGQNVPTDRNLQQATVNLFADMGVQPTTLMAELVAASMSTDFEDAITTITSHADGAVLAAGSPVTIRGTATDLGGGVVGVVEVSVDGGRSWHRATGRNNWSYTFTPRGSGEFTIMARATDDSGNIEDNGAHITVNPTSTPGVYRLWPNNQTPTIVDSNETASLELGVRFTTDVDGFITAVRFYKSSANTGTHTGHLWTADGQLLASATFTGESASGWQEVRFSQPVAVQANQTYVASYFAPNGHFSADRFYFSEFGVNNGPLHALRSGSNGTNGVYVYSNSSAFPTNSYQGSNYWVDVVFEIPAEPDTTAPTVSNGTPADGSADVLTSAVPKITFNEAMNASTVTASTVQLLNGNNVVAASVSYDVSTRTATIRPLAELAISTTYTIRVSGAEDIAGNALQGTFEADFTTASFIIQTSSLWPNSTVPGTTATNEPSSIELGVRFSSSADGYIAGVRFYKGSTNTGTHVGSLWSSTGQLLARATFTTETNSGWQEVLFETPVAISAGQTYVASYFAPNGNFSVDRLYFNGGYTNAPLSVANGGGVFAYGDSSEFPTSSFNGSNYWVDVLFYQYTTPDTTAPVVTSVAPQDGATSVGITSSAQVVFSEAMLAASINGSNVRLTAAGNAVAANVSYNAATRTATITPTASLQYSTEYSIVVSGVEDQASNALAGTFTSSFTTADAPPPPPADTTPPTVTSVNPAANATGVAITMNPTIVFSEGLNASTVSSSTVQLRAGNTTLAATVSYNATTRTVTLTPAASLAYSTTYTIWVSGVEDQAGNAIAGTYTSNFSTAAFVIQTSSFWSNGTTPGTTSSGENSSLELGVRFSSTVNGYVTGVRFYKGAGNTGTHTGSLWSSTGQLLARATFTSETGSGWQQVLFDSPVAITAGQTYVTSYFAPNGNFAVDRFYFSNAYNNGVLRVASSGGVFAYGNSSLFPSSSYNSSNYWVDVVFQQMLEPDTTPPTVTLTTPVASAGGVGIAVAPTVTFSETMNASTINGNTIRLLNGNAVVAAGVSYNASTRTATITPSGTLSYSTTYTVAVAGVQDGAGNALTGTYSYSFTTVDAPAPDTTAPTVTGVSPAANATGTSVSVRPTVSFSEAMTASTINNTNVRLLNGNTAIAATVSYNSSTNAATITPSTNLASSTTYTISVTGVRDLANNTLAGTFTSSFTTGAVVIQNSSLWGTPTPNITSINEPESLEVGVRFSSSVDGYVTGIRFYKGAGNTGTHTGSLWSSTGQLLARATFTSESNSGWQEVTFDTPVAITAGQTYTASYFAPNGNFAVNRNYFNQPYTSGPLTVSTSGGVFAYGNSSQFPTRSYNNSNYWVDVKFQQDVTPDTTAPTVTGVSPAANATGTSVSVRPTVSFSEAMTASTINNTNVRLLNGNTAIAATVSYNSSTNAATITPSTNLASSTTYTISVTGVRDLANNTLAGTFTSSFTTGAVVIQNSSLWGTPTPNITSINEPESLEVGVRFSSSVDGYVTGIRFYKGAGNTGTHTGSLWSSTGQLLARATFTSESNSGWQEVTFDTPVAITAGQTYTASYFAPNGNFAVNRNYFNQPYTSGPLTVSTSGGVFAYGNSSQFPTRSYNNSNYWVDVMFSYSVTP